VDIIEEEKRGILQKEQEKKVTAEDDSLFIES